MKTAFHLILWIILISSYLYAWSNIQHKKAEIQKNKAEISNQSEIINELLKELDKCR